MARVVRRAARERRTGPGAVPAAADARACERTPRVDPRAHLDRLRQTIPTESEPWFPGDEEVERRFRAFIRWNAAIMVHRAQRPGVGVGGHISTYASSAALYEVASTTSSAARTTPAAATRSSSRATPPPASTPARTSRAASTRRGWRVPSGAQSRRRGRRPAVVPAPPSDAGLLAVPDRLDGPRPDERHLPGALQPLPARPWDQGHLRTARLGVPRRRRDGRAGIARSRARGRHRGPRQPHLRHQLQPAASRRAGARQRQDHPGARVVLPGCRMERDQGGLGTRVGRPAARRP